MQQNEPSATKPQTPDTEGGTMKVTLGDDKQTQPTVNISVTSNLPQIGKTAIAAIITDALLTQGFENVRVFSMDGDFPKHANRDLLTVDDLAVEPLIQIDDTNGYGIGEFTTQFKVGPKTPGE